MIQFAKTLFNKVRHDIFGADRRRSRSERKLSSVSANSRGTIERPFMSEASFEIGQAQGEYQTPDKYYDPYYFDDQVVFE